MRRATNVAIAVFCIVACRRPPDPAPMRADLERQATIVCAEPAIRPAHAPSARFITAHDVEAALVNLCELERTDGGEACASSAPLDATCAAALRSAESALESVHDALSADRAMVGDARRSRLLVARPVIDMDALERGSPSAFASATKAVAGLGR